MFLTLHHVEKLAPHIWTFWFCPDAPVRFQAGQYLELHLPHSPMDNRGDKRWLTISSAPHEELLGITVRFAESGSSFKAALKQLQKGTRLYASEPIGDFVLPKDQGTPVVFVAAGIGTTPIISMVKDYCHRKESRQLHLIHGAHSTQDLVFDKFFRSSPIAYSPSVTLPDASWQGSVGRLNADKILALTEGIENKLFYFSGPENFIMELVYGLHERGLQRNQVVLDYFPGYNSTD